MYTVKLTYTDFNEVQKTEEHYFNLTEIELTKLLTSRNGYYYQYLQRVGNSGGFNDIVGVMEELVDAAYGIRTDDGAFLKSPEILAKFKATQAYSDFMMGLLQDDEKSAAFAVGIMPGKYHNDISKAIAEAEASQRGISIVENTAEPTVE